jgi:hypothetical protein
MAGGELQMMEGCYPTMIRKEADAHLALAFALL